MISRFVCEQKRYSQENLHSIFGTTPEKTVAIIKKLKEYGVLKAVKATERQMNMTELINEDIEVIDVEIGDYDFYYVFTFVGVITVSGCVLKCYPKYLSNIAPKTELKQIIKVLERYNDKEQIIQMYNDDGERNSFNLLAVMIYLLNDYFENGVYKNTQDIIEINGTGEILWEKSINETFTYLSNKRPYYTELYTHKRTYDDFDYFKRLHESIVSICSRELQDADLLDLFDILPVNLSDEELVDFGETDYILYRIQNELSLQYNTRKQLLLKTIYSYIAHSNRGLSDNECFTLFGTNSFNLVWEKVCSEVLDNQLQTPLGSLPITLANGYNPHDLLVALIEKPKWNGYKHDGTEFQKIPKETLVPDIVTIHNILNSNQFIIFDAKYYDIQLEYGKALRGQPGIGDITKQYLYQLAYKKFVDDHGIQYVKNCFLMPTELEHVIDKGYVNIDMLDAIGLQNIGIRFLPAGLMYSYYLADKKVDIGLLRL